MDESRDPSEVFLSPAQLAERYDIPRQNVYRWRMEGKGPKGLTIGRHVRFRLSDVLEWEKSMEDKG